MAVSYKKLLHRMIEEDISNQDLMRMSNISANIITKLRTGQYISLEKIESICNALHCTPNDVMEFIKEEK
ncbi:MULTISPECIES: helix-turn-helix transcriptional regulator [Gardnerella]|uniref:helix-turn-helix domain-containing protein n=1 Tax=Gardnerella TaxID=2701 RepID=UPI000C79E37E|nr:MULTISPECIES: helix-turn-helix transcriptional regulator [Gardnerella]PKZ45200.1 XRE family transcriptional regulator [Gardnerella vaginalis]